MNEEKEELLELLEDLNQEIDDDELEANIYILFVCFFIFSIYIYKLFF